MNKNLKKLVKRLRITRRSQCRNSLKDKNSRCALGIACELYMQEHPKQYKWNKQSELVRRKDGEGDSSYDIPLRIVKWLGLTCINADKIVSLNDIDRQSFKEIATYIEEHF